MAVSLEDVDHIASLARLGLTETERIALRAELESIVEYVGKLASVDVSHVQPTSSVVATPAPLRSDRVVNDDQADTLLSNAPDRDRTFLRVPKIIE